MPDEAEAKAESWMERHLQTLIMASLGAICSWMAFTTQGLTVQMATMSEKVSNLQESVKSERAQLYTRADADRDFALRDAVQTNLASRILAIEQKTK